MDPANRCMKKRETRILRRFFAKQGKKGVLDDDIADYAASKFMIKSHLTLPAQRTVAG